MLHARHRGLRSGSLLRLRRLHRAMRRREWEDACGSSLELLSGLVAGLRAHAARLPLAELGEAFLHFLRQDAAVTVMLDVLLDEEVRGSGAVDQGLIDVGN